MLILVFLSTQEATSGTSTSDSIGRHLFLAMNFSSSVSKEVIVSHMPMRRRRTMHTFLKLRPVISEHSAYCSGIAGALHLEGGYCHELTIFTT